MNDFGRTILTLCYDNWQQFYCFNLFCYKNSNSMAKQIINSQKIIENFYSHSNLTINIDYQCIYIIFSVNLLTNFSTMICYWYNQQSEHWQH